MNILSRNACVGPIFRGVYPSHPLPSSEPGAYVLNTAPACHPGKHWIALYLTEDEVDYFDSYGGEPTKKLKRWVKARTWTCNPVPLQSPLSAVCGQYCIYYLFHCARGLDLPVILIDFSSDVDHNDQLVYDFVQERYDLDQLKLIDTEGVITQLARACISVPRIRNPVSGW